MRLTQKITKAARGTYQDYKAIGGYIKTRKSSSDYYDKRELNALELYVISTIPIQFISRLSRRSFWNIDNITRTAEKPHSLN